MYKYKFWFISVVFSTKDQAGCRFHSSQAAAKTDAISLFRPFIYSSLYSDLNSAFTYLHANDLNNNVMKSNPPTRPSLFEFISCVGFLGTHYKDLEEIITIHVAKQKHFQHISDTYFSG